MSIELRAVNAENWRELIKLKVKDDQQNFVASNLYSIAEAQFGYEDDGHWDFHPFGLYANGNPVGFVMYCLNLQHPRFQGFVARLMVDEKFQGSGYGRDAMKLVMDKMRGDENIRAVGISYEPHNEPARKLYATLGFVETGELIEEETLAVVQLR